MKYLTNYKLFESNDKDLDISELKSKIFRFYTPIPLSRTQSSHVIKKIFNHYDIPYFNVLKDKKINLNNIGEDEHNKLKNSLRFEEYLNTLLGEKSLETGTIIDKSGRGFNFEGLISGLFGGDLSKDPSSTYDLTIKSVGNLSVKFSDKKSELPRLTSIKNILELDSVKSLKSYDIINDNGLVGLIKWNIDWLENYTKLSNDLGYDVTYDQLLEDIEEVLNITFNEVDYFVMGHPENNTIIISVISKSNMIKFILENGLNAQKSSTGDIRISSSIFKEETKYVDNKIILNIPKLSKEDITKVYNGKNRDWADSIFGDWSSKMRTDFIDYFYDNRKRICVGIKAFDEYRLKDDFKD